MHTALAECRFQSRYQPVCGLDSAALSVVRSRIGGKIRISKGHAEIRKAVYLLLPTDHAVGVVLKNQNDHVKTKAHRRFHLLGVYHEAAVAAHCEHAATRMQ